MKILKKKLKNPGRAVYCFEEHLRISIFPYVLKAFNELKLKFKNYFKIEYVLLGHQKQTNKKKLHDHHLGMGAWVAESQRASSGFAFQAAPFVPQSSREWQQCGCGSLAPGHKGILNAN